MPGVCSIQQWPLFLCQMVYAICYLKVIWHLDSRWAVFCFVFCNAMDWTKGLVCPPTLTLTLSLFFLCTLRQDSTELIFSSIDWVSLIYADLEIQYWIKHTLSYLMFKVQYHMIGIWVFHPFYGWGVLVAWIYSRSRSCWIIENCIAHSLELWGDLRVTWLIYLEVGLLCPT